MSLFPLLWQATKFYNHKEIMVRTAVRTIILGVMKSLHFISIISLISFAKKIPC